MSKTYNLFISHSWAYGDAYDRLLDLLDSVESFSYRNYSVPSNNPIVDADSKDDLYEAIWERMTFCHAVLILGGVYATYSEWIQTEIECAVDDLDKPIVAVRPRGNERVSAVVQGSADAVVSWNARSIVKAIRDVAIRM